MIVKLVLAINAKNAKMDTRIQELVIRLQTQNIVTLGNIFVVTILLSLVQLISTITKVSIITSITIPVTIID